MTTPQEPQPEQTPSEPGPVAPQGASPGPGTTASQAGPAHDGGVDEPDLLHGGSGESGDVDDGRPGRKAKKQKSATASAVEWVLVIGGAIVLAIVVKAFLLQAFYIPSASMYPTLQKGDRVLVNKLSYRLHDVNRGDVVVFERPPSETATDIPDLIKRVVGLPGEQIVIEGGHVYADGRMLDEPYLPAGVTTTADNTPYRCTRDDPCQVPDGDVWVMGDNRNDSKDSRYFGPIEESTIVGRAFVVVWPLDRLGML